MVVILVGVVMGGDDNSGDIVDVGDGPAAAGDAGSGIQVGLVVIMHMVMLMMLVLLIP